jgi:hypothetical protein
MSIPLLKVLMTVVTVFSAQLSGTRSRVDDKREERT